MLALGAMVRTATTSGCASATALAVAAAGVSVKPAATDGVQPSAMGSTTSRLPATVAVNASRHAGAPPTAPVASTRTSRSGASTRSAAATSVADVGGTHGEVKVAPLPAAVYTNAAPPVVVVQSHDAAPVRLYTCAAAAATFAMCTDMPLSEPPSTP